MNYQLTVLISNKLDEKKRSDLLDSVNKDLGGKAKADLWGVRGLAYPIRHEDKAFYAHYDFEAEPGVIPTIDRKLKLNEDIIRYLLIKIEEKTPKVAAKTAKKAEKKAEKAESTEIEEAPAEESPESPEETETPETK